MNFTLYPAIDLKDGQCVRLLRGEMDQATVFSDSPADQAKAFREAGFTHLHVVDLNGAFEGKAVNRDAVEAILKATDAPVQLGGGIRTRAQIDAWLEAGISRVILGTAALRDPELVKEATAFFNTRISLARNQLAGQRQQIAQQERKIDEVTARLDNNRHRLTLLLEQIGISEQRFRRALADRVRALRPGSAEIRCRGMPAAGHDLRGAVEGDPAPRRLGH